MTAAPPDTESRLALIQRNCAELLTEAELRRLLESGQPLRHYIGFEISGRIHIGHGLVCMAKIADFQRAGVSCHVLLADWHTWVNDKLGGEREAIREVALGYFADGLRAGLRCVGGDPDAVTFVLGSDLYHHNDDYWATLIEVSKHTTLARMQRSISIMGREEGDSIDFAKLVYPPMQVADIFIQGINLAHAGMDQRKAHVIARDVALQLTISPLLGAHGERIKPLAVHHNVIMGLSAPGVPIPEGAAKRELVTAMKMSKSKPASAIFIHDEPDVIARKVRKAYCPPGEAELNPVLDWVRSLVFNIGGGPFEVDRRPENGGPLSLPDYGAVERAYLDGSLHPMDLKAALTAWLVDTLAPAREHFAKPQARRQLEELERRLEPARGTGR
ncbi:MAG: tyrosine--tRNA ligase [Candidatus Dormibacteria bacterium]